MSGEPPEKVQKLGGDGDGEGDGEVPYTITTMHSRTYVVTISPMVTVNVLKEAIAQQLYDGDIAWFCLFCRSEKLRKETPLYKIKSTDLHLVFCRAGDSY